MDIHILNLVFAIALYTEGQFFHPTCIVMTSVFWATPSCYVQVMWCRGLNLTVVYKESNDLINF